MNPELADAVTTQIGIELQALREHRGLRLDDLADDAHLSPASLSLYLRGKRPMPMRAILLVCNALGADPGDIITRAHAAVTVPR